MTDGNRLAAPQQDRDLQTEATLPLWVCVDIAHCPGGQRKGLREVRELLLHLFAQVAVLANEQQQIAAQRRGPSGAKAGAD